MKLKNLDKLLTSLIAKPFPTGEHSELENTHKPKLPPLHPYQTSIRIRALLVTLLILALLIGITFISGYYLTHFVQTIILTLGK